MHTYAIRTQIWGVREREIEVLSAPALPSDSLFAAACTSKSATDLAKALSLVQIEEYWKLAAGDNTRTGLRKS